MKKVKNKISIIIPVYNSERTIDNCIKSILDQIENDEIILINDGSTDSSYDICRFYVNKYGDNVKVLNIENNGVSNARNIGIKHASGEWIMFVDSDDEIIEKSLEEIRNQLDEVVDMVYFNYIGTNENLIYTGKVSYISQEEAERFSYDYVGNIDDISKYFSIHNMIFSPCWGKIYRKSMLDKNYIRFNNELILSEDLCFNVKCINYARQIKTCDIPIYKYKLNPVSVTHSFRLDHIIKRKKLIEYMLTIVPLNYVNEEAKEKYILLTVLRLCENILYSENTKKGVKLFKEIVKNQEVNRIIKKFKKEKISNGKFQKYYYAIVLHLLKYNMPKGALFTGMIYSKLKSFIFDEETREGFHGRVNKRHNTRI